LKRRSEPSNENGLPSKQLILLPRVRGQPKLLGADQLVKERVDEKEEDVKGKVGRNLLRFWKDGFRPPDREGKVATGMVAGGLGPTEPLPESSNDRSRGNELLLKPQA
jgi:hypothetical protein